MPPSTSGLPLPRKKRKKVTNSAPSPAWETTRFFQQPKPEASSLPTVLDNGVVRPSSNPTKTLRSASAAEASSQKSDANASQDHAHGGKSDRAASDGRKLKRTVSQLQPPSLKMQRVASRAQGEKPLSGPSTAIPQRRSRLIGKDVKKTISVEEAKTLIASLATSIVANPQQQVAKLSQLRQMASQYKGAVLSLILLTESQLYKDLAPAYRIRPITQKEAETKVSKDIARLRSYEQALLSSYQRFVRSCVSISRSYGVGNIDAQAAKDMASVRHAACKALSELLRSLPHFNEVDFLIQAVCSLVGDRENTIRSQACEALTGLLADAHKMSGQALETCVSIAKKLAQAAASKSRAVTEETVTPLSEINFSAFPLLPGSQKNKTIQKKPKRLSMRKREILAKKKKSEQNEPDLDQDLAEGDADSTPQEMYAARKSLLDSVCLSCFNIIKAASSDVIEDEKSSVREKKGIPIRRRKPPPALSPALRGLLRVSRYINTDVIEAIIAALTPILQAPRFPLAIRMRCISAAYAILGHHSQTQKSDPDSFTSDARAMDAALYASLGALYDQDGRICEELTFDAMEAVLAAYSYRHVPVSRAAAMARRLCIQAISSAPTHACTIGLLKAGQLLLDPSLVSCIFSPDKNRNGTDAADELDMGLIQDCNISTDDPDLAEAERSAAWELSALLHHFHPTVRAIADECVNGRCGSCLPQTSESIVLVAKRHMSHEGGFNPIVQEQPSSTTVQKNIISKNMMTDNVLVSSITNEDARREFLEADNELE